MILGLDAHLAAGGHALSGQRVGVDDAGIDRLADLVLDDTGGDAEASRDAACRKAERNAVGLGVGCRAGIRKRVDVVAKGTTVTLALTGSDFALTMTDPGLPAKVTSGTWTSSSDTMSLKPAGMTWSWQFDMSQSGNNLTLNGASVEFDFAANGVMEQAKLYMTLVRQ